MKYTSRLIALTVTAVLATSSIPLAGSASVSLHASGYSQENSWPEELTQTVKEAKEAFEQEHTISPDMADRLAASKELLLAAATAHLTLIPKSPQQTKASLPDDWRFWCEAAKPWKDSRLLPVLLDWTADFPMDVYDSRSYVQLVTSLLSDNDKDLMLHRLSTANRDGARIVLTILEDKGWLDESRIGEWLTAYSGKPQQDGILDYLVYQQKTDSLMHAYDQQYLTADQKKRLITSLIGLSAPHSAVQDWLRHLAATTIEPSIEQMIDQVLVLDHGDNDAVERLYRSGTIYGYLAPLNGRVEKILADKYPSGELADGIRQYEAIRGSYFYGLDDTTWYSSEGNDFANPEQAIEQWLAYLKKFPHHPAADDAAYRLARCYQLAGDGESALYWLDQAVSLGDRDMGYDARGVLLFVLDVEMSASKLSAVRPERLPAWMKPWISYSQAVETMRERRYGEAAQLLRSFTAAYAGKDLFTEAYKAVREDGGAELSFAPEPYPFWEQVNKQLALAERMAKLTEEAQAAVGAEKADKQYALAAAIYREPLLYYNHLWQGQRQDFFWFGHIKEMSYYEPLERYIARFNHLVQAIDQFQAVDLGQASQATAAKALFSTALSYSKLIDYGEEISFYSSASVLANKMQAYAKQLVDSYPDSELADDALMLSFHYSHDKQWLEQLISRYPDGDQVLEAGQLLARLEARQSGQGQDEEERPYYDPGYSARYEHLRLDDKRLPASVQSWIEENSAVPYHGTLEEGEWVYVLLSAGEGSEIDYMSMNSQGAHMRVVWQQRASAEGSKQPQMMLARVKKSFVPDTEWIWKMYAPES